MLVDAEPTPPFSRHLVPAERVEFSAHGRTELLAQGGQRRGRPGARSRQQPIDRAREHDPSPVSSSTHRSGGRYDSSCAGSGRGARSRSIRSSKASPDRKSTRLNSSHVKISYAVFCLKKKKDLATDTAHTPQALGRWTP